MSWRKSFREAFGRLRYQAVGGELLGFRQLGEPREHAALERLPIQPALYRASKCRISFAVGALAFIAPILLVNTLRVYKHTSAKSLGLNVTPDIGLESVGSWLTLRS